MTTRSRSLILPVIAFVSLFGTLPLHAQRPAAKTRESTIADAVAYLKKSQAPDGTWSRSSHIGITGLVAAGLLRGGQVPADDPQLAKALAVIESLKNDEQGDLANDSMLFHKNYVTSVNVGVLVATKQEKYRPLIEKAVGYLKQAQIDESESKSTTDLEYGGFGYQPGTRPDVSNTQFALDALMNAGVPSGDAVYKKAAVFVSRTQNLESKHNLQPWAGKINDGSFIYVLAAGRGSTTPPDAPRPGYGSMTYCGLKCLTHAGIPQNDERVAAGLKWLAKNYTVDAHPGREAGAGGQGYYYYLMVMAKSLNTLGVNEFVDAQGQKHDWRADITRALMNRQEADGSWHNIFRTWQESNADLCTAYALATLAYTQPKAQ